MASSFIGIRARREVIRDPGGGLHPAEPARWLLAALPTPVERLTALPAARGLDESQCLLVKRDDRTGFGVSGNKVRKLEYLVAEAVAQGADTLVTMGGIQSNHCRATAAVAARLGLKCRLMLRGEAPGQESRQLQELPGARGNLLLDDLLGAEVSFHGAGEYSGDREAMIAGVLGALRGRGRRPYFFGTGGSVALGSWGYVRMMFELAGQLEEAQARAGGAGATSGGVDVFCAVGSCGTHAGCVIGRALRGLEDWRVVGVPIAGTSSGMAEETRKLVDETIEKFGLGLTAEQTPVEMLDGFVGEGYAIPSAAGTAAIREAALHEGLILDPSYTGKAMAGVLDAMASGRVRDGAAAVFIHSGGGMGLMGAAGSAGGWSA